MIDIVELLARSDPLTLADIVRLTGMSRATAHAVVSEMTGHGWVRRNQGGTYRIGDAFTELAGAVARDDPLSTKAAGVLDRLSEETGFDCFLARRAVDEVVVSEHTSPHIEEAAAGNPVVGDPVVGDGGAHGWPRVGQRVALTPPVCREFVAWETSEVRSEWIARAPQSLRTRLALALDAVRDRGASIERMTDDHVSMITAIGQIDTIPDRLRSRVTEILGELTMVDYLPTELPDDPDAHVAVVSVGTPVFDVDAHVIASIVCCPNGIVPAGELRRIIDHSRRAAGRLGARRS